jgi:uncharacterized protein
MTPADFQAAIALTPVPSPCVSVCQMNDITGVCEGCLRTLDEIACWSVLDDEAKRAVWGDLAQRRAAADQAG